MRQSLPNHYKTSCVHFLLIWICFLHFLFSVGCLCHFWFFFVLSLRKTLEPTDLRFEKDSKWLDSQLGGQLLLEINKGRPGGAWSHPINLYNQGWDGNYDEWTAWEDDDLSGRDNGSSGRDNENFFRRMGITGVAENLNQRLGGVQQTGSGVKRPGTNLEPTVRVDIDPKHESVPIPRTQGHGS